MEFIKFKRFRDDAIIPTRGTERAAGLDLYALDDFVIPGESWHKFDIGIGIDWPIGKYGEVIPRSGHAKYGISIANSIGCIDEDYRGSIAVTLINHGQNSFLVEKGDRIAQLLIKDWKRYELVEVDKLSETVRGTGGHGHTGK